MLKLDLAFKLLTIYNELGMEYFLNLPEEKGTPLNGIQLALINSKTKFDQLMISPDYKELISLLELDKHLTGSFYSELLKSIISFPQNGAQLSSLLTLKEFRMFYAQIEATAASLRVIKRLFPDSIRDSLEAKSFTLTQINMENLNLNSVQVISDSEIKLIELINILKALDSALNGIFEYVEKADNEKIETYPTITFIDSGSDLNINFNLPEKASEIFSNFLKEIWEFVSNNKIFKFKKKIEGIEAHLSIMAKIKDAEDSKTIDVETANRIRNALNKGINGIIKHNVVSKEYLLESRTFSNREFVLSQSKMLLISENQTDEDNKGETSEIN